VVSAPGAHGFSCVGGALYNVQMKRYTASGLRARLSEVLDAAERGEEVLIERRGTRFALHAHRPGRAVRTHRVPLFDIVDPAVADGRWTWAWSARGLTFKRRNKQR
jgi:antitoxin (DNA-binding transcriptional repressor) of toxin-antitoxin stability system